jgi:hypothetical protein
MSLTVSLGVYKKRIARTSGRGGGPNGHVPVDTYPTYLNRVVRDTERDRTAAEPTQTDMGLGPARPRAAHAVDSQACDVQAQGHVALDASLHR